jgi:divalent metal cation (Fe/Co/Zn/Cd) transporter
MTLAWALTGSVGLLSDAAESVVNLVAAMFALAALHWALKPADEEHTYGHAKAEYFSAGVEGALILVAAAAIAIPQSIASSTHSRSMTSASAWLYPYSPR